LVQPVQDLVITVGLDGVLFLPCPIVALDLNSLYA
jgi:hypothetical protein